MTNMTPQGKKAQKLFKIVDDFIGWIKNKMKKDDILIICSDHGFKYNKHTININSLFKKYGLIKTKLTVDYRINSGWANVQKMWDNNTKKKYYFLSKIYKEILNNPFFKPFENINENFKNFFLVRWINYIFKKFFGSPFYKEIIDYNKSLAFIPSPEWMGICINKKYQNFNQTRNTLIKIFKNIKYNGKNIFKKVFCNNEIFYGNFVDLGPDIILLSEDFVPSAHINKKVVTPNYPNSTHRMNGIFIAYGNEIKKKVKIDYVNIYDIVPTILHAFDLEIPSSMDGKVLKIIYEENSEYAKREMKFFNESAKIKDIIRTLTKLRNF